MVLREHRRHLYARRPKAARGRDQGRSQGRSQGRRREHGGLMVRRTVRRMVLVAARREVRRFLEDTRVGRDGVAAPCGDALRTAGATKQRSKRAAAAATAAAAAAVVAAAAADRAAGVEGEGGEGKGAGGGVASAGRERRAELVASSGSAWRCKGPGWGRAGREGVGRTHRQHLKKGRRRGKEEKGGEGRRTEGKGREREGKGRDSMSPLGELGAAVGCACIN